MYFAGVDSGSSYTKVVITKDRVKHCQVIILTGGDSPAAAERAMKVALDEGNLTPRDISYTVATGYGRANISFAEKTATDIFCQVVSIQRDFPNVKTIIDVGGQDVKGIKVGDGGRVLNFTYNDKCAAGTGRFLEVLARVMEIDVDELGPLSLKAKNVIPISSSCTVFAESEIVTLIAKAVPKTDIIAGLHKSIAERICTLVGRIGLEKDLVLTGGVAQNVGFVRALEQELGFGVIIPKDPQFTAAVGAAYIALETFKGGAIRSANAKG